MAKYIDADLLRKEIERRIKELHEAEIDYREDQCDTIASCLVSGISELQRVLYFLSNLKPEKPMNLEEEINWYLHEECSDDDEPGIHEIAEHFAEWGYLRAVEKYNEIEYNRQRAEESVPNDLEEAAREYFKKEWNSDYQDFEECVIDAFVTGAEWKKGQMMKDGNVILAEEDFDAEKEKSVEWGYNLCKEQMMEEAVEGEIDANYFGYKVIRPNQKQLDALLESMNHGDKVRIIIVKEDDK